MSYGFNEDKSKFDLEAMQQQIDGKANASHTHNVSDLSGVLPIQNGGTGGATAAAARTALGATSRRSLTNTTTDSGTTDVSVKAFQPSAKNIAANGTGAWTINVNRNGYIPIAVELADVLPAKTYISQMYIGEAASSTNATVYFNVTNIGTSTVSVQPIIVVRYLKASMLNQ